VVRLSSCLFHLFFPNFLFLVSCFRPLGFFFDPFLFRSFSFLFSNVCLFEHSLFFNRVVGCASLRVHLFSARLACRTFLASRVALGVSVPFSRWRLGSRLDPGRGVGRRRGCRCRCRERERHRERHRESAPAARAACCVVGVGVEVAVAVLPRGRREVAAARVASLLRFVALRAPRSTFMLQWGGVGEVAVLPLPRGRREVAVYRRAKEARRSGERAVKWRSADADDDGVVRVTVTQRRGRRIGVLSVLELCVLPRRRRAVA
jgi:hypothetical protein